MILWKSFNIENLVNISCDITLNSNLKWPKYGTKYGISCIIFMIGWGLFLCNGNVIMASNFGISPCSIEVMILHAGALTGISIFLTNWYLDLDIIIYICFCYIINIFSNFIVPDFLYFLLPGVAGAIWNYLH